MVIVGYIEVYTTGALFIDETGFWVKKLPTNPHNLNYINAHPIEFDIFNFGIEFVIFNFGEEE